MDVLLDPNFAYLVLVIATILAILALLSPGSGVIEVGAVIAALLAAYSIYRLPLNGWALAILWSEERSFWERFSAKIDAGCWQLPSSAL